MWWARTTTLLVSACLLSALSAHAIWPQPALYGANKTQSFARVSSDLRFNLVDGTDKTRVPSDLTDAIVAATKLANSIDLWPLTPGRGEEDRAAVNAAPLISGVQIKVLELMPETTPNPCAKKQIAEAPLEARSLQAPFQGRLKAIHDVQLDDTTQNQATANTETAEVWSNACSIANRAIKEVDYKVSSKPLDLRTDKSAPADLGFLDAEMYRIDVPQDGSSIRLTSYTALGALRGLQTLLQLIYSLPPQGGKSQRFIRNVPNVITDRPAYPYRGLLLDTSRNWFDLPTIRKLIDTMQFVKLNQLHWHATDTHSWPLAFEGELSVLADKGSYGWTYVDGQLVRMVYTEADIKDIIDYAAARGINVIIETDMPAHMLEGVQAVGGGELMACPNRPDWQSVAAEPPSGQLRLVSNGTTLNTTDVGTFTVPGPIKTFVSTLLRKTASLSKSVYVSSGGDEPNFHCWNLSSEAAMEPYLAKFMAVVTNVTTAAGKKGVVWEEMAVKFPTVAKTLGKGSLVGIWNDPNNAGIAIENNPDVKVVLAPYTFFYLDCGGPVFLGNTTNNNWCPYVSWQKTYSFDPSVVIANATAVNPGLKGVRERFVGGESAVWSEQIDAQNLDVKVWPRAAAGAEVWWSGEVANGKKREPIEALERLLELRWRLVARGVRAEPLQPLWCALRVGECNLY
ncbi:Glycoside hydrolase family 20, catalytic core [Kalmanozyma brasiliensis GHG001]|uniref:Beta-hexosaminidase n=1 Tax=Kalmanozyma brasiliensis (strain GHG001) TaxID=1365824 RepID=V5EWF8_KALBG|nr:Glycoside hydrolase family 20, catalytic core [Kalmanozyma brasiliensis GHG001]EST06629.1 Glycoside hydrolase family 20, catalytic core [Kalmanozyma brasiliensis GHG001]